MLKGLKIEFEPVLKSRRDVFGTDGAVQHLGWIATKKISAAKKPSAWGATPSVMMAFLFVIGIAFMVQELVTKLEWYGKTNNAWWVEDVLADDPIFEERNVNEYFHNNNYLAKPIVLSLVHDLFGVKTVYAAETWEGMFEGVTHNVINIEPGKAITVEARFKNSGANYWLNSGTREVSLRTVSSPSKFQHSFWPAETKPAILLENRVNSGETSTFRFALQAPMIPGQYSESFVVVVNDVGNITEQFIITMNVTGFGGVASPEEPVSEINIEKNIISEVLTTPETSETKENSAETERATIDPEIINTSEEILNEADIISEENYENEESMIEQTTDAVKTNIIMEEPLIRVGLYEAEEFVIITSSHGYNIASEENTEGVMVPAETRAAVSYDTASQKYLVTAGRTNVFSKSVRFIPQDGSYMTLLNFENPVKWDPTLNDNRFRGTIEMARSERTESTWVINELPLEMYLKGITETSNISPLAYHKSIAVAARSYALWHMQDGSRHKGKGFDVDARLDQVYRGFNSELRLPTFVQAVEETKGIVVTYDGDIALTTYFAQSDGRTRDYEEVWGGTPLPYLRSVPDETNEGLKLFGHGVGLSARGALIQASRYDSSFDEILNYYYTDIGIEKRYDSDTSLDPAV